MTSAVFSPGLWRLRQDISTLLGKNVVLPIPGTKPGLCVGWGRRPSFQRARKYSQTHQLELVTLEDGFLSGYSSSLNEPRHSYVVDRTGIYFDTAHDNDLERLVRAVEPGPDDLRRARDTMQLMVRERITKFNCWPEPTAADAALLRRPYVLLIDQVPGDASLIGAGAGPDCFRDMVRLAADTLGERQILLRTHPANAQKSALVSAARELGVRHAMCPPVNPLLAVEQADEVWTVASQLGFEAAIAGKVVHCMGRAFYAGRGFTRDHFDAPALAPCTLEKLFLLFYRDYMRCLDLHTRQPCSLDHALAQALYVRDQRNRLPARIHAGGFSPWKRKATAPFLIGRKGKANFHLTRAAAEKAALGNESLVATWGVPRDRPASPSVMIEDGFIRSSGLGVALVLPCSLALDQQTSHFDCSRPSDLEQLLQTHSFSAAAIKRAAALRETLVAKGVTKYNTGSTASLPVVAEGRLKILVPGQVEADASIRHGSPLVRTNKALVAAVREHFPDAFIAYKIHPDAAAGLRSCGDVPEQHDHLATDGAIQDWIFWSDRVETMTSLTGFEALLRGKAVGVHGIPAYAGWGLTDDRMPVPRRSRRLSLDELVAGMLIAYPSYVHPASRLPCSPEELVEALATFKPQPSTVSHRLAAAINRLAIRIRDARH